MKTIHIIAKTHLDLGFTDYAEKVELLYNSTFIPKAISLAEELNTGGKKRFIWTTGSWVIENALNNSDQTNKAKLDIALRKGDIKPHGLPFTTHTELLDEDAFRYGLEIAQKLKKEYNLNISAAKMTDVPGHTKAIVPLLDEYGIKLLHIGVNDSSAMPFTPQAFLWKAYGKEVIVLYEGSYGSLYKNEHIEDILYFAHSHDNDGPNSKDNIIKTYEKLQKMYPDYQIQASTLDDYADELWKVKDKLPILTSEIGDSWIHGGASDPYKSAAIRELIRLKTKWLEEGEFTRESHEYRNLTNYILVLCEHTWGMDVKKHLSDIGVYLKKDFKKARQTDNVKLKYKTLFGFEWKIRTEKFRKKGIYAQGSYKKIEKSWLEQREYIQKALSQLPQKLKSEAENKLKLLIPDKGFDRKDYVQTEKTAFIKDNHIIELNQYGGIKKLVLAGNIIVSQNENSALDYCSYGAKDYDFWLSNYSRNIDKNKSWVIPDFGRPLLNHYDNKYKQGTFSYKLKNVYVKEENRETCILVSLEIERQLCDELGAPSEIEIKYCISSEEALLTQEIIWMNKDASRLTEALFLHYNLLFDENSLTYIKMGKEIDPYDIVVNGNRNLSAVEQVNFKSNGEKYCIKNYHSPLVSLGKGKILRFDNVLEDAQKEGISFNLYNNVWGTNFPLWYSDNAYFKFQIVKK